MEQVLITKLKDIHKKCHVGEQLDGFFFFIKNESSLPEILTFICYDELIYIYIWMIRKLF